MATSRRGGHCAPAARGGGPGRPDRGWGGGRGGPDRVSFFMSADGPELGQVGQTWKPRSGTRSTCWVAVRSAVALQRGAERGGEAAVADDRGNLRERVELGWHPDEASDVRCPALAQRGSHAACGPVRERQEAIVAGRAPERRGSASSLGPTGSTTLAVALTPPASPVSASTTLSTRSSEDASTSTESQAKTLVEEHQY